MKGFTELVWKGREALIALNSATKAQAAANALLSASNKSTAATQGALTAAQGAGGLAGGGGIATGSVGLGLGGIGAAAGGLAAAAAGGLVLFEGMQALRRGIFGANEASESLVGAMVSWRDEAGQATKSTERLEKAQKEQAKREEESRRFSDRQSSDAGYRASRRETQAVVQQARFEAGGGAKNPIETANEQRLVALREVFAAEQEYAAATKENQQRIANGHAATVEDQLRAIQHLEESNRRLLESDTQRLGVLRDQKKMAEEQVKASKEGITAAQDAQRSELQRFAGLSRHKQSEARRIAENETNGVKHTERDVRFLEQNGLGGDIVRNFRSQQGAAAGGESVLAALSPGYRDAQRAEEETRKRSIEGQNTIQRASAGERRTTQAVNQEAGRQLQLNQERIGLQQQVEGEQLMKQAKERAVDRLDPADLGKYGGADRSFNPNPFDPNAAPQPIQEELQQRRQRAGHAPDKSQLFYDKSPAQSSTGEAADSITKESIEVSQSIQTMMDATLAALRDIKDTADKHELTKKGYSLA